MSETHNFEDVGNTPEMTFDEGERLGDKLHFVVELMEKNGHTVSTDDICNPEFNFRRLYLKMSVKYHPDKGGDPEEFGPLRDANEFVNDYVKTNDNCVNYVRWYCKDPEAAMQWKDEVTVKPDAQQQKSQSQSETHTSAHANSSAHSSSFAPSASKKKKTNGNKKQTPTKDTKRKKNENTTVVPSKSLKKTHTLDNFMNTLQNLVDTVLRTFYPQNYPKNFKVTLDCTFQLLNDGKKKMSEMTYQRVLKMKNKTVQEAYMSMFGDIEFYTKNIKKNAWVNQWKNNLGLTNKNDKYEGPLKATTLKIVSP